MIKRFFLFAGILSLLLLIVSNHQVINQEPVTGRWQKIESSGIPISDWSGPWACVFDSGSGLLWEVKTDNESIHDGYWSYSWFDGELGVENMGDCYYEPDRCDTLDLIRRTNEKKLCGVSDWRVPTVQELTTIVESDVQPGAPLIAESFFPHVKRGDYWTSTSGQPLQGAFRHLGEGAFAINFIDGKKYPLPYRNAAFLMLVSSEYNHPNKTKR